MGSVMPTPISNTDVRVNEAGELYARGNIEASRHLCQQAITSGATHPDLFHLMGLIDLDQGRADSAVEQVRRAVQADGSNPDYLNTLGVALKSCGRFDEAAACLRQALSLQPEFPKAYNNLGLVLKAKGQPRRAVTCFRQAVKLEANFCQAHYSLGVALKQMGRLDEAMAAFDRTLDLQPNHAGALNNCGGIHMLRGKVNRAIACFQKAVTLEPEFAMAWTNLAMAWFLKGDLSAAWPAYEWRFKIDHRASIYPHEYDKPRWDGAALGHQTLLIHDEQGLGDTLQFIRYLPMVKARGGKILFETRKSMITLLKDFPGIDSIVQRSESACAESNFDLYIPLLSLPLIFKTTLQTIPQTIPYIVADKAKVDHWRRRIHSQGLRIGLAWAGNPTHHRDKERSLPVGALMPLMEIPNLKLYSLQEKFLPDPSQVLPEKLVIDNLGVELKDFADIAAAIASLDLVIAVDTAVVHLAGAMGKTVWTLLSYAADWRWGMKTNHSPWYPSMTLFRQKTAGDWKGVIDRVCRALGDLPAPFN
jgi:Flp pilus assembly protein TadD